MGRETEQLAGTFTYQRLVAAQRMAVMLFDHCMDRPGARSIRLESSVATAKGWDDHVETWRVDGRDISHGWQIKQQVESMSRDVAEALWASLATSTLDAFTLAIAESCRVSGVGTIGQLRSLTRRLRNRRPDECSLGSSERKWLKFAGETMELGEAEAGSRLAKVTVELIGDEDRIRREMSVALGSLYRPPVDQLVITLEAFAFSLGGGVEVTAFDLEQTVLAKFADQRAHHVPTYCRDRNQYLTTLSSILAMRRAGNRLFRDTPPLANVWVTVSERLAGEAEVELAPKERRQPSGATE